MRQPHLTPAKLLGDRPLPPNWARAKTAFICYTPFPRGFTPYLEAVSEQRHFIHSPLSEVRLCRFLDIPFLVVSEVYGFPVGATTVEELAYHGINTIFGIGYAGAFKAAPMGKKFIAMETISDLPLARHYGVEAMRAVRPSQYLLDIVQAILRGQSEAWGRFIMWNSNSLYREYPALVQMMKDQGCDAVNMDVLSLYAVAPVCAREAKRDIQYIYVGTVTDVESSDEENWSSDLAEVVSGKGKNPHDDLVHFMVEEVLPRIDQT
jgi:uridine phosphorylase